MSEHTTVALTDKERETVAHIAAERYVLLNAIRELYESMLDSSPLVRFDAGQDFASLYHAACAELGVPHVE